MLSILNWIVQGLMEWLYGLIWDAGEYIMNTLMSVFAMDLSYFEEAVPISTVILAIMYAVGWALLLGNLVFQAAKSMMSGLGFEGEDPRILFARTLVFAVLLLCSRQICDIGLSIGSNVVSLLQIPGRISLPNFSSGMFSIDASWLIVLIMGIILIFQLVKFFFEVGERYVILGVLTILSPLAFAMGVSRNTKDIFKGWTRMYGSMCLMMVLNVVFVKLIVSAMTVFPHGLSAIPWLILVIGLVRVARKIDNIVARIGLNPAITGAGLGRGFPGMMAMMVGRSLLSNIISKAAAGKAGASAAATGATSRPVSGTAFGFSNRAYAATSPINTSTSNVNASASSINPTVGAPVNPPVGGEFKSSSRATGQLAANSHFSQQRSPVQGYGKDSIHNANGNPIPTGGVKPDIQDGSPIPPSLSKSHHSMPISNARQKPLRTSPTQPANPPIQQATEPSYPFAIQNETNHQPGVPNTPAPQAPTSHVDAVSPVQTEPTNIRPSPSGPQQQTVSQVSSEHGQSKQSSAVSGSTSVYSHNATPIQTSALSTQQSARVQFGDQQSSSDSTVVANTQSTQQNAQTNPQDKGNPLSHPPSQNPIPVSGDSGPPAQSKAPAVHTGNPAAPSPPREQKPQSNPQSPSIKAVDKPVRNKDKAPQSIVHEREQKVNTAKVQPEKQTGIGKQHKAKSSQTQEPIDTNANFQKQLNPDPDANPDMSNTAGEEATYE